MVRVEESLRLVTCSTQQHNGMIQASGVYPECVERTSSRLQSHTSDGIESDSVCSVCHRRRRGFGSGGVSIDTTSGYNMLKILQMSSEQLSEYAEDVCDADPEWLCSN